ncbi:MAG: CoA transferase [Bacteroidota bacterium]
MKFLEGITVLEFSQFMAGPSAGLKIADLGARVIKIERPGSGEGGRQIVIKNLFVGDDSLVFHTINRNKESYAANLKDGEDLARVKKLIAQSDVMTHNFRPGVMEKIGLDYASVQKINPRMVYGEVSGYSSQGPWASKPGQDLLIQAVSGLTYLTGNKNDPPTPMGMAVVDMLTGAHLTQGLLAALVQRGKTGKGAKVSVSLLESALDFQFEVLTAYLNSEQQPPQRAETGNAHAYLGAPYGVYPTQDGHFALAMIPLPKLTDFMQTELPEAYKEPAVWFEKRDEIMGWLSNHFKQKTTRTWLHKLESAGVWCAEVLNYVELMNHAGYRVLQMEQVVETSNGTIIQTTRCPIRVDGERIFSRRSAPKVGEDNQPIEAEFNLTDLPR